MVDQINARVDEKLKATALELTDQITQAVREASHADVVRDLQEDVREELARQRNAVRALSDELREVRGRIDAELEPKLERQAVALASLEQKVELLLEGMRTQDQLLDSITRKIDQGLSDLDEAVRLARGLERQAHLSWWQRLTGWRRWAE